MASKAEQEFYALAELHKIEIEYTSGWFSRDIGSIPYYIMCDAPKGYIFKGTELHCDGGIQGNEGTIKTDWKQAKGYLQELINEGIIECPHGAECEYCYPDEE